MESYHAKTVTALIHCALPVTHVAVKMHWVPAGISEQLGVQPLAQGQKDI